MQKGLFIPNDFMCGIKETKQMNNHNKKDNKKPVLTIETKLVITREEVGREMGEIVDGD